MMAELQPPSTLFRIGSLLRGKPDPGMEWMQIQEKIRLANEDRDFKKQQLQLGQDQLKRQALNDLLDFTAKMDLDEDTATQITRTIIKKDPTLSSYFGNDIDKITISPKAKAPITITRHFEENELPDKTKPGTFLPKGPYKVKGIFKNGAFDYIEAEPVETPEQKRQAQEDRQAGIEGRFEQSQERLAGQFQQSQAGIEKRHGETLNALQNRQQFQQADALRREYLQQNKIFIEVRDMFGRVQSSAKKPSPAGDLSMIFAYMKMLDPASVVRESEFAVAETARPLVEKMGISWDRVKSVWEGKRLTDSQRADFLNRGKQIFDKQSEAYRLTNSEFRRTAAAYGLNPDNVVIDLMGQSGGPMPAPTGKKKPTIQSIEKVTE